MPKSEPKCTEITVSSSVGGKVQIVKFEFSVDFHYSMTRTYDVPADWTEKDVAAYQIDKAVEIRGELEDVANNEVAELMKQRDELKGEL